MSFETYPRRSGTDEDFLSEVFPFVLPMISTVVIRANDWISEKVVFRHIDF